MLAGETRQPTPPGARPSEMDEYLKAKVERMRHLIDLPLDLAASVVQAGVAPMFNTGSATGVRGSPMAVDGPLTTDRCDIWVRVICFGSRHIIFVNGTLRCVVSVVPDDDGLQFHACAGCHAGGWVLRPPRGSR
ncbi:MAG: hypothetical protein BJ554DRAFT_5364, partial [Olpidium bornovanus]